MFNDWFSMSTEFWKFKIVFKKKTNSGNSDNDSSYVYESLENLYNIDDNINSENSIQKRKYANLNLKRSIWTQQNKLF